MTGVSELRDCYGSVRGKRLRAVLGFTLSRSPPCLKSSSRKSFATSRSLSRHPDQPSRPLPNPLFRTPSPRLELTQRPFSPPIPLE